MLSTSRWARSETARGWATSWRSTRSRNSIAPQYSWWIRMRSARSSPATSGNPPRSQYSSNALRTSSRRRVDKGPSASMPLEVEELTEREGEDLPRQRPAAHLGRDLPRQHPSRRARDVHLALLGAHQAVDERLPARHGLDLVEEAVDRLGVLLLRVEREIGVRHDTRPLVLQVVEAVVEEVQVEDVVARHAAIEQLLHLLEQERRLAGAPRTDADGGLARHRRHVDPTRDAGRQLGVAEVEDDVAQGVWHRASGLYCRRKFHLLAIDPSTYGMDRQVCSSEDRQPTRELPS